MGLIKSAVGAARSTLADQWKEYIYCDSLDNDVIMKKGQRRVGANGSNKGDTNVISDGSLIAVNEGQFLIVVENGAIVDYTAEPGEYTYDTGTEPTLLDGEFDLSKTFEELKKRFTFGGTAAKDQRVYFVNTKEILNCKIGLTGIPFRDGEFNLTVNLRGYGSYTYRITNPLVFYVNICGNTADAYRSQALADQMRSELQRASLSAFAKLSELKISYDKLLAHTDELCDALAAELVDCWGETRGISIRSLALASITPDDASAEKIRQMQESRVYSDTDMLGARLGAAQASAMEDAANNSAGAVTGFMGVNMAQQNSAAALLSELKKDAPSGSWKCECGEMNSGKFCSECGKKRPAPAEWVCQCGASGTGKFCSECGSKRPE